jgi:hypothetical protein
MKQREKKKKERKAGRKKKCIRLHHGKTVVIVYSFFEMSGCIKV